VPERRTRAAILHQVCGCGGVRDLVHPRRVLRSVEPGCIERFVVADQFTAIRDKRHDPGANFAGLACIDRVCVRLLGDSHLIAPWDSHPHPGFSLAGFACIDRVCVLGHDALTATRDGYPT
jgi:hypothetical protein